MACPAGFYCPSPLSAPVTCASGTYQTSTGQTSCLSCPAGQSCIDRAASPVDCNAGFYSTVGEEVCQVGLYMLVTSDARLVFTHIGLISWQVGLFFLYPTMSFVSCQVGLYRYQSHLMPVGFCTDQSHLMVGRFVYVSVSSHAR